MIYLSQNRDELTESPNLFERKVQKSTNLQRANQTPLPYVKVHWSALISWSSILTCKCTSINCCQTWNLFLRTIVSSKVFKKADKRILIHHIPLYGCNNLCKDLWEPLLKKAPFEVSLNAHTHKFAHHPKGSLGNNYPVVIGGGNRIENATVMILEKKKDELRIKVLDAKGNVLLDIAE